MGSTSARKLAQALNTRRVYPDKRYKHKWLHAVINWGCSTLPTWYNHNRFVLNHPKNVAVATNKLSTFMFLKLQNVPHPEWTQYKSQAEAWINEGHKVFCRQALTSHSGHGIIISTCLEELVDAPLYVKAVKKDKEYRVHVFNGKVIDYQQKKRKLNYDGPSTSGIRNHGNGWVYARDDVDLPDMARDASIRAVAALKLDFGAVDVATSLDGNIYVFEVNTAPGLHGTTLTKYTEAINEMLLL